MAHPYHETFWVVAGTTAPVIALAAVVAYGQLAEVWPGKDDDEPATEKVLIVASLALVISFLTQGAVLGTALLSIADHRDRWGVPGLPFWLIGAGVLLLWIGALPTGVVMDRATGRKKLTTAALAMDSSDSGSPPSSR